MKKTIILTFTAVLFIASSILAFANVNLDELGTKTTQCSPNCCEESACPENCCSGGGSSCCKK